MKRLNIGRNRTTYQVELLHSPLYEAALGIAAATYDQMHHTMEHPPDYWQQLLTELPPEVQAEVAYAKEHNTWKTLLQLLHQHPSEDLEGFTSSIRQLPAEELRYLALPYLGKEAQHSRREAASGSEEAVASLRQTCRDHLFFPAYISFVTSVDPEALRNHLIHLIRGWYLTHVKPREEQITRMLKQDRTQKEALMEKLSAEELVSLATEGDYPPEPTVTRVILIPQAIYRPWTVQADAEDTKIFYYPVAEQHVYEQIDPYRPPQSLVQTMKALGDEHRLRLVKILAEQEKSLQELTELLQIGKSTVHHHLSLLRAANLVKTTGTKYTLRRSALDRLPVLLEQFIGREEAKEELF
jgi:DNA-binding transcriptional ArsR family regulator